MRGKLIKSLAAAGICAAIAAGATATTFAADKTYHIAELGGMTISLPDNFTAVDRSAPDSATYFSLFGLDYNKVMSEMNSNDIYLQGMDNTASVTVTVRMTENENTQTVGNYSSLSAEKLTEFAHEFLKQPEYTAFRLGTVGGPVTWLSFDTSVGGAAGYLANTVYNGKSISISLDRPGADVTDADFQTFTNIVNSVNFGGSPILSFLQEYWLYLAVGAAALVLIIILIVVITKSVKSSRERRRQQDDHDQILEELADKYTRKSSRKETEHAEPEEPDAPVTPAVPAAAATPDEPKSKFSDAQLAEILGEELPQDFPEALPEQFEEEPSTTPLPRSEADTALTAPMTEAAPAEETPTPEAPEDAVPAEDTPTARENPEEKTEEDGITADDDDDDFFAGVTFDGEVAEVMAQTRVERIADSDEPDEDVIEELTEVPEAVEESTPEEETSEETASEKEETTEETAPEKEETPEEDTPDEEDTPEEEAHGEEAQSDDEPDELEEYMNDEELVRSQAKANKFKDSNDFFDEAPPRHSVGVINSRDIADAEEYDVLGEEEKRAEAVKQDEPEPEKGKKKKNKSKNKNKNKNKKKKFGGFLAVLAGIAGGVWSGLKYFFVHCGYFIINLSRAIKRHRMKKKRQKAEEERRRRARERAARQRAQAQQQRENGGLVQVRSRGERRPPQSTQRRPSGSRPANAQRRPSGGKRPASAQRRPSNNRRPAQPNRRPTNTRR